MRKAGYNLSLYSTNAGEIIGISIVHNTRLEEGSAFAGVNVVAPGDLIVCSVNLVSHPLDGRDGACAGFCIINTGVRRLWLTFD